MTQIAAVWRTAGIWKIRIVTILLTPNIWMVRLEAILRTSDIYEIGRMGILRTPDICTIIDIRIYPNGYPKMVHTDPMNNANLGDIQRSPRCESIVPWMTVSRIVLFTRIDTGQRRGGISLVVMSLFHRISAAFYWRVAHSALLDIRVRWPDRAIHIL